MTPKEKKFAKEQAINTLRERLKPGSTVYTVVTHRSASGMSRSIKCVIICLPIKGQDGPDLWDISGYVAHALGYSLDNRYGGVKVSGCGMDMGFHLVHSLGYALHGMQSKGDGAKEGTQTLNFKTRPGHYRAGYSLTHCWI